MKRNKKSKSAEWFPLLGSISRSEDWVGVHPDKWLEKQSSFSIRAERPIRSLELDLWIPADLKGQNFVLFINGEERVDSGFGANGDVKRELDVEFPAGGEATISFTRALASPGGDERELAAILERVIAHHS